MKREYVTGEVPRGTSNNQNSTSNIEGRDRRRAADSTLGINVAAWAGSAAKQGQQAQEWWVHLSPGERRLIRNLMGLLRGAKRSRMQDVAQAAAKWERGIGCFIKVRLINGANRWRQRVMRKR